MSEQLEQSICDLEQKLSTLRLPHKLKQYRTYENQLQQLGEQIENQHGSVNGSYRERMDRMQQQLDQSVLCGIGQCFLCGGANGETSMIPSYKRSISAGVGTCKTNGTFPKYSKQVSCSPMAPITDYSIMIPSDASTTSTEADVTTSSITTMSTSLSPTPSPMSEISTTTDIDGDAVATAADDDAVTAKSLKTGVEMNDASFTPINVEHDEQHTLNIDQQCRNSVPSQGDHDNNNNNESCVTSSSSSSTVSSTLSIDHVGMCATKSLQSKSPSPSPSPSPPPLPPKSPSITMNNRSMATNVKKPIMTLPFQQANSYRAYKDFINHYTTERSKTNTVSDKRAA